MNGTVRVGLLAVALSLFAASAALAASKGPCSAERSASDVKTMVDRCQQVSPATHPPCNGANACTVIEDEISRGCSALAEAQRPQFCADYLDN